MAHHTHRRRRAIGDWGCAPNPRLARRRFFADPYYRDRSVRVLSLCAGNGNAVLQIRLPGVVTLEMNLVGREIRRENEIEITELIAPLGRCLGSLARRCVQCGARARKSHRVQVMQPIVHRGIVCHSNWLFRWRGGSLFRSCGPTCGQDDGTVQDNFLHDVTHRNCDREARRS